MIRATHNRIIIGFFVLRLVSSSTNHYYLSIKVIVIKICKKLIEAEHFMPPTCFNKISITPFFRFVNTKPIFFVIFIVPMYILS